MRNSFSIVFIFFSFILIGGCKINAIDNGDIEDFVLSFHDKFNSGKYNEIYEEAADGMKKNIEADVFIGLMKAIKESLGGVNFSKKTGAATPAKSDQGEDLLFVRFKTSYGNGEADEAFYLQKNEGNLTLFRYDINSDLVLKELIGR